MTIKREKLEAGIAYSDPDIDVTGPRLAPVHPGEILRDEFLEPMGITSYRLAADIHVTTDRILRIVKGTRSLTADTALRLSRYFGNSAAFWMQLQLAYDLAVARRDHGKKIVQEVGYRAAS